MADRPLTLAAMSFAMGALAAEIDERLPGTIKGARKRLKNEVARSLVWGLHGEHETDEQRLDHADAVTLLDRLDGIVAPSRAERSGKRRRKRV